MTSSGTNAKGTPAGSPSPGSGSSGSAPWAAAWELLLPAASAPARARGRTLQEALRESVRSGRLAPGTRLPASRELAADLGVSRGLVTEAYEQLTAEGYLRSGRGAGTWVGDAVRAARPGVRDLAPRAADARADFVPGTPDLSLFPRAAWAAAQRGVLAELPTTHWATRIRAGCPGCAPPSPSFSPGAVVWSPIRSGSSWSPGSRRR